jgi:hypothetical protein
LSKSIYHHVSRSEVGIRPQQCAQLAMAATRCRHMHLAQVGFSGVVDTQTPPSIQWPHPVCSASGEPPIIRSIGIPPVLTKRITNTVANTAKAMLSHVV